MRLPTRTSISSCTGCSHRRRPSLWPCPPRRVVGRGRRRVSRSVPSRLRAALERAGIDGSGVDEVVMSETYRGDLPGCSARPVALRAGVPVSVPGFNLNMHCGTGLKAIVQAGQMIRCGDAQTVLVVAMESMSRAAFLMRGARTGLQLGHVTFVGYIV